MQKPSCIHWMNILKEEFDKEYFIELEKEIDMARRHSTSIYPQQWDVWKALDFCPIWRVEVVILGQDPYHNKGQADGLAFSVKSAEKVPPSLKNIFRAVKSDIGIDNTEGSLEYWAVQGVLLLNTVLTVEDGKAMSHRNKGWENITDILVRAVASLERPIVFMLWGKEAEKKREFIDESKHLVLTASHPSPNVIATGGNFLFCKHFSQCNEFLAANGFSPIDWRTR